MQLRGMGISNAGNYSWLYLAVAYRALYLSGNALNGTLPSLALGALRYVGFLLLGTVLIDIDEQLYRTDCVICSVLNLANNSLSGTLPSGLSLLS